MSVALERLRAMSKAGCPTDSEEALDAWKQEWMGNVVQLTSQDQARESTVLLRVAFSGLIMDQFEGAAA